MGQRQGDVGAEHVHPVYRDFPGFADALLLESCIWDKDGHASVWSAPGSWTMGLLKPEDWTAQWITASKWFMPPEYRPKGLELGPKGGWADVDLGALLPINSIKLYPGNPADFPARFTVEGVDNFQFLNPTTLVDQSKQDYVLNGNGAQEFPASGTFRFIRLAVSASSGKKGSAVRQMESSREARM